MEAAVEEQLELYVLINKAIVHFRELPESFMTRGHIKTRIDSLDEYWQTFKTKHFELVKMAAVHGIKKEGYSYFKHEMFYSADNAYKNAKGIMLDELDKIICENTKNDWERLAVCNEEIFKVIKSVGANIQKQSESLKTIGYLQARITTLDDYWHKFCTTHFEILKSAAIKQEHTYFKQEVFIQCEEEYITIKGKLVDLLEKLNHPSSKVGQKADNCSEDKKQPAGDNLQFGENSKEWNSFKDVCGALINEKLTLENIQNISDQAANLLKYLKPDEKGDSLESSKEYRNRREDVQKCLYLLTNEKKIQQPISKSIKKFLDDTQSRLSVLKQGLDITNWDPILIHILSNKLDQNSLKKWVKEVETLPTHELPTLQRFIDFLDLHYKSLSQDGSSQNLSDVADSDYSDSNINFEKIMNKARRGNEAVFPKPQPYCYNCLKVGHHGHECQYYE